MAICQYKTADSFKIQFEQYFSGWCVSNRIILSSVVCSMERQAYAARQLSSQMSTWERIGGSVRVIHWALGHNGFLLVHSQRSGCTLSQHLFAMACESHFIPKTSTTGTGMYFPHSYGFHRIQVGNYKCLLIMVKLLVQGIPWGKNKSSLYTRCQDQFEMSRRVKKKKKSPNTPSNQI